MIRRIVLIALLVTGCTTVYNKINRDPHVEPDIVVDALDTSYWKPVYKFAAQYPPLALRNGIEGCAYVSYIIDSNGRVASAEVLKSIPSKLFDEASLVAVRKFRFEPGASNPNRLPVRTSDTIVFTLQRGSEPAYWYKKCEM